MTIPAALPVIAPYPALPGFALALILFFGRGQGRGGRATAKPTGSRRSSADGFAVKYGADESGGQDCQILFPVFGGEMATAKIQTVKGLRVESCKQMSSPKMKNF